MMAGISSKYYLRIKQTQLSLTLIVDAESRIIVPSQSSIEHLFYDMKKFNGKTLVCVFEVGKRQSL